jgi:hypothetical protein
MAVGIILHFPYPTMTGGANYKNLYLAGYTAAT